MYTLSSGRVQFGAFELDLSTGELRSIEAPDPNDRVLLREQVFQVLRMLIEREDKILTREEIKGRLWPNDTVVDFDHGINATIKALRLKWGGLRDKSIFDWTGADVSYRRAVELEPGSPDFAVFAALSAAILGRLDEALQLSRRAVDLDPLNARSWGG
jgi:hypothetical protein